MLDLYESPTDTIAQLQAFLAALTEHRQVLKRQREDLNATLEDLAQYDAQARALLKSALMDEIGAGLQKNTLN